MAVPNPERAVFGSTGEIGRDGVLSPELQLLLNQIQDNAANRATDRLNQSGPEAKSPLVAMATGVGKGRVIHLVVEKELRRNPKAKILIIAGTKNVLVEQTHDSLAEHQQRDEIVFSDPSKQEIVFNQNSQKNYIESDNLDVETEETAVVDDELPTEKSFLYTTGKLGSPEANVHVATIQSVLSAVNRERIDPRDYDLTVIDEVHNIGTPLRLQTINKFERRVGFTATPYRNSGKLRSPEQYGFEVVDSLTLPEAQEARFLPPLLGVQIDTKGLVDDIPLTKTGQIDFRALEKILKNSPDLRPYLADRVASIINSDGNSYKTVMAVNFVWEAQELAELLTQKGIKVGVAVNQNAAKEIDSPRIPAIDAVERYKLPAKDPNAVQVLISPYVASEGFDAPFTEVLVWASPTDSDLRYTQYTGRLARRANGKLFGVVVDSLYQTSQYNWSYNFGMWMKGHVRQLDNGLLWLGPETEIDKLKTLPVVENIRKQADVKPMDDLQLIRLQPIQDTDMPLTRVSLDAMFQGETVRKLASVQEIRAKLESDHPEYFATRKNYSEIVAVITEEGKQLFIDEMLKAGYKLKEEMSEPQDTDLRLTAKTMNAMFVPNWKSSGPIMKRVKETLEAEHPEYFATRKYEFEKRVEYGEVVTEAGRQAFIEAMVAAGVPLKPEDAKNLEDTDLALTKQGSEVYSLELGQKLMKI